MPRQARQIIADIPYHIVNRGNNHQQIFFNDDDYQFFCRALKRAKARYPCKIYSFVLMTNHVHLLIEPQQNGNNLTSFMKQISQRHGQYINKKYQRTGTLWEGRFRSSPISTDLYLLACSQYIEMNPVRIGLAGRPEGYKYSSYGAKIGLHTIDWLDFDPIYESFGKTGAERQYEYGRWFLENTVLFECAHIREAINKNRPYGNDRFKEKWGRVRNLNSRPFSNAKQERKL